MKIPAKLQQSSPRERKRTKERIVREAERKKKEFSFDTSSNPLRKPAVTVTLLMVMAVVGALLLGRSKNPPKRKRSLKTRATLELRALYIASGRFFNDCGRYPDAEENLKALVINPGMRSWRGPYVNIVKPDPWKCKYIYIVSNNTVTVFSSGPDRTSGTADDVYPYESI